MSPLYIPVEPPGIGLLNKTFNELPGKVSAVILLFI